MNVTIFGSGYVGLVTGACLAETGNSVVCVDVDEQKIENLNQGEIPIYEPGLEEIVKRNVASGRLSFTSDAQTAVAHGIIQFIAVGTPPLEDGSSDYSHVLAVAKTIGQYADDYKLVVDKSTVPVGTAEKVAAEISQQLQIRNADVVIDIAANPEFLKEGAAVTDFMRPDRIIVGTESEQAARLFRALYDPFTRNHDRLMIMDIRSAEMTKYAANAMLATKISFMNELANLAEDLGADIEQVRQGIGADPRIGYHFIYPGCGFGGSCFPKDITALISSAKTAGQQMRLLEAVRDVNSAQKKVLFQKVSDYFGGQLAGKTFALWGLAFKPNTDDMREASSLTLLEALWQAGAKVRAYDPVAGDAAARIFGDRGDLEIVATATEALQQADALILVTEWTEFRSPDFKHLAELMNNAVIFDGRNVYEPELVEQHGVEYYGIGRGRSIKRGAP